MGTLCAMETIHLFDKEREVEPEYRVPEKPIATRARSLFLDFRYRRRKAAMNGIASTARRSSVISLDTFHRIHDIRTADIS